MADSAGMIKRSRPEGTFFLFIFSVSSIHPYPPSSIPSSFFLYSQSLFSYGYKA